MAISTTETRSNGVIYKYSAVVTDDAVGGTATLELGFTPKSVKVIDPVGALVYEWYEGMAATDFIEQVGAAVGASVPAASVDTDAGTVTLTLTGANQDFNVVAES